MCSSPVYLHVCLFMYDSIWPGLILKQRQLHRLSLHVSTLLNKFLFANNLGPHYLLCCYVNLFFFLQRVSWFQWEWRCKLKMGQKYWRELFFICECLRTHAREGKALRLDREWWGRNQTKQGKKWKSHSRVVLCTRGRGNSPCRGKEGVQFDRNGILRCSIPR